MTDRQTSKEFSYRPKLAKKWTWRRTGKLLLTVFLVLLTSILLLAALGTAAHAAGLVDDTINSTNGYSKHPLDNYQLDFYVDTGWDWLPWNWLDGIGKQVMYGLYAITNFIWTISLYLSNATGYLVQEAYSLDFISATAESIGKNMQTLAGVTPQGLSSDGFYTGFLLILILIVGIYVTYTGLIKRETTKAVRSLVNFLTVFLLSGAFIAYAPDYIGKINDFSADISNASLSLGTKIVMPNTESKGKDSVDLIRDSLFSIQVQQPWLLLQYGNSDMEAIGKERVEKLLSTSPYENNGEDREEIVEEEIEDRDNANLTVTKTINRLGTAFFLFLFNIGISVFVFLLTGIMIFSQVLFIIYAMFLPVSFLISMVPTFEGMSKRAITKLFNTILTRAGITLVITAAFSISTMLYSLSGDYPFFLIAFLQIVTFAGIYFKLGDLMSMFSLQSGDSQGVGKQIMRRPRMLMHAHIHRLQHRLGRSIAALGTSTSRNTPRSSSSPVPSAATAGKQESDHQNPQNDRKEPFSRRAGQAVGAVLDTKERLRDHAGRMKEQAKEIPVQTAYALHHGKEQAAEGVHTFASTVSQTRVKRKEDRMGQMAARRKTIAERRMELERAKKQKKPVTKPEKSPSNTHERTSSTVSRNRPSASEVKPKTRPDTAKIQTDRETEPASREQKNRAVKPPAREQRPVPSIASQPVDQKERQPIQPIAAQRLTGSPVMPQNRKDKPDTPMSERIQQKQTLPAVTPDNRTKKQQQSVQERTTNRQKQAIVSKTPPKAVKAAKMTIRKGGQKK